MFPKKTPQKKELQRLHFLQDFDAPIKNVFSFFSDHNRLGEIYPAFIRRITDAPNPANCNDVGSSRVIVRIPLVMQETITQYIENNYLEYKITLGSPLKNHIGKMKFIELSPSKTRLEYIIEFEPWIPYTGFLLSQINSKVVQDALGTLAIKFKQNPNY
ncbi:MAG: SRPBCC family protein [Chitinophagales bacterium]|nr:SRPBCC family protein [Chitinophagales bacterium]